MPYGFEILRLALAFSKEPTQAKRCSNKDDQFEHRNLAKIG
jgi:hypothetical protein